MMVTSSQLVIARNVSNIAKEKNLGDNRYSKKRFQRLMRASRERELVLASQLHHMRTLALSIRTPGARAGQTSGFVVMDSFKESWCAIPRW